MLVMGSKNSTREEIHCHSGKLCVSDKHCYQTLTVQCILGKVNDCIHLQKPNKTGHFTFTPLSKTLNTCSPKIYNPASLYFLFK